MSVMKREFNLNTGHREEEQREKAEERVVADLEKRRIVQERKAREIHEQMLGNITERHKRQIEDFERTRKEQERIAGQDWTAQYDRHQRQEALLNQRHNGLAGRLLRTVDITGTVARKQERERLSLEDRQAHERRNLQQLHDRRAQNLAQARTDAIRQADRAREDLRLVFEQSRDARRERYDKEQAFRVRGDVKRTLSGERSNIRKVRSRGLWDD